MTPREQELEEKVAALGARFDALQQASASLVRSVDALIADPQFKGVFTMAYIHGMAYTGPQIGDELEALRALLPDIAKPVTG